MKKWIALILITILFVPSICCSESSFENRLEHSVKLSQPLSDELPSIVSLYQCGILASLVTPSMSWEQLETLASQLNLQPQRTVNAIDGAELRRIYFFSPVLGIELVGNPIQSQSLVFVYRDVAEQYIELPLSIDYTAHTKYYGTELKNTTSSMCCTPDEQLPVAAYMDYLLHVKETSEWNNLGNDTLLYSFLEFICFTHAVELGMSQEKVLNISELFTFFSSEDCTHETDELIWSFNESEKGRIDFHFVFDEYRLTRVCFKVYPISVFNACLPYSVFHDIESEEYTSFYGPNVYILLSEPTLSE